LVLALIVSKFSILAVPKPSTLVVKEIIPLSIVVLAPTVNVVPSNVKLDSPLIRPAVPVAVNT